MLNAARKNVVVQPSIVYQQHVPIAPTVLVMEVASDLWYGRGVRSDHAGVWDDRVSRIRGREEKWLGGLVYQRCHICERQWRSYRGHVSDGKYQIPVGQKGHSSPSVMVFSGAPVVE